MLEHIHVKRGLVCGERDRCIARSRRDGDGVVREVMDVDETDVFDEDSLGGKYQPFYHALKGGEWSRIYCLLEELRRDLISEQRLPARQDC